MTNDRFEVTEAGRRAVAEYDAPQSAVRTHALKSWPCYFEAVVDGRKRFELRKNDRDFCRGDVLLLREYDRVSDSFSGRMAHFRVTWITVDAEFGLQPGHCCMSIEPLIEAAVHEPRKPVWHCFDCGEVRDSNLATCTCGGVFVSPIVGRPNPRDLPCELCGRSLIGELVTRTATGWRCFMGCAGDAAGEGEPHSEAGGRCQCRIVRSTNPAGTTLVVCDWCRASCTKEELANLEVLSK